MSFNLRKRTRFSYYEPKEPSFDEYIYCEQCADFVYDYCAVHGPLLVIPDSTVILYLIPVSSILTLWHQGPWNKGKEWNGIPEKTNNSLHIPRAALTIPDVFLHLAPSIIPDAGLGVFSTLTLPRGVRFGPYCGQLMQTVDSMYCWQIFGNNNKRLHVVDAADQERSNWMRYVNCARHSKEQNLLAFQYKGQVYYRTIKIIPRHTELMVFYGSEFANALHINLKQYNSAKYYKEAIISSPAKSLHENKGKRIQEDFVPADQFHFIDEDDNSKNSTKVIVKTDEKTETKENDETKDTSNIRQICMTCQKTYANEKNLKVHALKHSNIWKYNCEYCLYKTNAKYAYMQHVGYHTNTYQFTCEICPFKTNYRRTFKKHILRHENDTEIFKKKPRAVEKICNICDYKTNSHKAFVTHMSKHNGIVYECDKCSYSNHSKYNLSRHLIRHGH